MLVIVSGASVLSDGGFTSAEVLAKDWLAEVLEKDWLAEVLS
jgi:hypothetical protein